MGEDERQNKEKDVHALPMKEPAPIPREQLEKVFREHHARVLAAAFRITGSSDDAEDALQTVFLRLLRREDSPDLSSTPGAYLHRAAINAALDIVRSRSNSRSTSIDDCSTQVEDETTPSPERQLVGREMKDRLRHAVATLNTASAEVFVLRYFEGYSNQEIARMTGSTQGAVGVTLHRARYRLKDMLDLAEGESS